MDETALRQIIGQPADSQAFQPFSRSKIHRSPENSRARPKPASSPVLNRLSRRSQRVTHAKSLAHRIFNSTNVRIS